MATNNAINAPFPFVTTIGGTGLSTLTAHGIMIGESPGPMQQVVLANQTILVGETAANPAAYTLVNGANVSIAFDSGAKTITFSATNGPSWVNVTGSSQALAANTVYVANNAGLVTFTLPATAALGDTFTIIGLGAGGWQVNQNSGQIINIGNTATTITTGTLASTNKNDQITISCVTANTTFAARDAWGNITIT